MLKSLSRFSMGIGDRFGKQGKAQLDALISAKQQGVLVTPVWNKSHREHVIIHSDPADTRREADEAVRARHWDLAWFVDADHVHLNNVEAFIPFCDFFTLDVAEFIGQRAEEDRIEAFVSFCEALPRDPDIPGLSSQDRKKDRIRQIAETYLAAVEEAGKTYRHIRERKGDAPFLTEVSMDETASPQTPAELFYILAALAQENVPVETIAPKFSGRFNKGVDYVGDVETFSREFEEDVQVVQKARDLFGLPGTLKLSVHSGSDKFALYGPVREILNRHDAGLHIKTAGTTWLEEVIGLAEAGGRAWELVKTIYAQAWGRFDELCGPYASVIDIQRAALPDTDDLHTWEGSRFARALRHDPACPDYNSDLRQMMHVSYKIAAEMGNRYIDALKEFEPVISVHVRDNLFERHIKPLFIG